MQMKEQSTEFMGLLSNKIIAYEALLQVLKEEKCIIALCDYKRLIETSKKKEMSIHHIKSLENQIVLLQVKMMTKMGITQKEFAIEDFFRLFENTHQRRFFSLRRDLRQLAGEVQELNSGNKRLLENVLSLIKDSFSLLSNMAAPSPIYYRTGRLNNASISGNLISGAI